MPDVWVDVLERPVAAVAVEAIAGIVSVRAGREDAPLHAVHVEEPVAIVIEQADAAAGHLGELVNRG